jgi:hypothetical protein
VVGVCNRRAPRPGAWTGAGRAPTATRCHRPCLLHTGRLRRCAAAVLVFGGRAVASVATASAQEVYRDARVGRVLEHGDTVTWVRPRGAAAGVDTLTFVRAAGRLWFLRGGRRHAVGPEAARALEFGIAESKRARTLLRASGDTSFDMPREP